MKTLNKLEKIKQLQILEETKQLFVAQLNVVNDEHFMKGSITFDTKTKVHKLKPKVTPVPFNRDLMAGYLNAEIQELTRKSDKIIRELSSDLDKITKAVGQTRLDI